MKKILRKLYDYHKGMCDRYLEKAEKYQKNGEEHIARYYLEKAGKHNLKVGIMFDLQWRYDIKAEERRS